MYFPNTEKDTKNFFNSISKYLVTSRNLILGGDFNCILNTKYDKIGKGANLLYGHDGSKELSNLCSNYNLVDIFRHLNPHMFATTWHAPSSKYTDQNKFIPTLKLSVILIFVGYFLICVMQYLRNTFKKRFTAKVYFKIVLTSFNVILSIFIPFKCPHF